MFFYVILFYAIGWVIIHFISHLDFSTLSVSMFKRRVRHIDVLLRNNFVDSQVWFAAKFKAVANVSIIKEIDATRAYELVMKSFGKEVTVIHKFNTFNYDVNAAVFNVTIFVLKNKRMIELGQEYAVLLYTSADYGWANDLMAELAKCRITSRTNVIGFANAQAMN